MTASSERRLERRKRLLLGGSLLGLATLLSYAPVLRAGFIWDDTLYLVTNPFVKLPMGLFYIWFSSALPDYYPVTLTSFWLEWRVWGMNATGYHLTNLLLHAGSAVLLWRVLRRLQIPGAWLAALVFAVHPINVQSVAWIAERKNTLCMFFFLLSVLWYLRFDSECRITDHESPTRKWYCLSLLAFLLALLSKTAVVALPVWLLVLAWWRRGRVTRRDWLQAAPFFLLALALGLASVWFQKHRAIAGDVIRPEDFPTRLAAAGQAIWFYVFKVLWPRELCFLYPQWKVNSQALLSWVPLGLGLLVLGTFAAFRRRWGRPFLVASLYFVLMVAPILGLIDIYFHRYSLVSDHYVYFAGPALIVLGAGLGVWIFRRVRSEARWCLAVVAVGIVGWLGAATWRQTRIYENMQTLWEDTLAKNPNCWLAHNSLGSLYASAGYIEQARTHYAEALALKPDAVETLNNFASVLLDQGNAKEALGYLHKALEASPQSAMAHYNLGNAYDQLGDSKEAERYYRRALEFDPTHAESHSNLGCLLYAAGRKQEAIDEFARAISLKPDYAEALNNLGALFLEQGRSQQAESLLLDAVRHKADYPDAWFNLGNALLPQGRVKEAAAAYRRVVGLNPQHALAHCRLGTALWHGGEAKGALAALGSALQLQPNLAEAHHQTGIILAAENQPAAALVHLRRAVELQPDWPEALAGLGFTLATAASEKERDGAEALRVATRAVELTGRTNFTALDALAAAYAESATFADAARTAATAAELARTVGDTNRAEQIQVRRKLYESGKPYRQ